jgi:hypothetical protein
MSEGNNCMLKNNDYVVCVSGASVGIYVRDRSMSCGVTDDVRNEPL